ncbi:neuropeptide SIFamide receptor-like [Saccostrea cucullata]|uniref:neuropeptide SIFamide receptor-like n=1 Tax=Saccostrea cuccullata TaxID=36930 RepID=UPI002ED5C10B
MERNSSSDSLNVSFTRELKHELEVVIIYSVAYALIFLFALFGNLTVIIVVIRHRWMHTKTNFFIVNLACADLLVAIVVMPINTMINIFIDWRYGAVLCKLTPYLQGISVCASVNTLAAIAIDRCLAICYPLQYKITWRTCKIIMCGIWLFSIVIMIPNLLVYNIDDTYSVTMSFCLTKWPSATLEAVYFLVGNLLFCYSLPLALIITCYCVIGFKVWNRKAPGVYGSNGVIHRSKIKVVKMLVVVVVMFAASWFPLWVIQIKIRLEPDSKDYIAVFNYVIPICQWLGSANSGINPIIYCLFSKKIRTRIKTMLLCRKTEYEVPRNLSSYASTRYVSVDYTNGHVTLRTNGSQKERKSSRTDRLFNNVYD